jgi:hypothetical protein
MSASQSVNASIITTYPHNAEHSPASLAAAAAHLCARKPGTSSSVTMLGCSRPTRSTADLRQAAGEAAASIRWGEQRGQQCTAQWQRNRMTSLFRLICWTPAVIKSCTAGVSVDLVLMRAAAATLTCSWPPHTHRSSAPEKTRSFSFFLPDTFWQGGLRCSQSTGGSARRPERSCATTCST